MTFHYKAYSSNIQTSEWDEATRMPGGFSICLQYRFGEYTAEDVTRFVEQGKLTPEQYEGITGEKYDASVVEQQETVQ